MKTRFVTMFAAAGLLLCMGTKPSIRDFGPKTRALVRELSHSKKAKSAPRLEKLNAIYDRYAPLGLKKEDAELFLESYLSYPDKELLGHVLLGKKKAYQPRHRLNLDLIRKRQLYDAVPPLVEYLQGDLPAMLADFWMLKEYYDLLGESGRSEAKKYLRGMLARVRRDNPVLLGAVIVNLARLDDGKSKERILDICEEDLLDPPRMGNGLVVDCFRAFTSYRDPAYLGLVIENLGQRDLMALFPSYVIAPFCMDEKYYSVYAERESSYRDAAKAARRWRDWHEKKRGEIVFNEEFGRFIEKGTEEEVRGWREKRHRE